MCRGDYRQICEDCGKIIWHDDPGKQEPKAFLHRKKFYCLTCLEKLHDITPSKDHPKDCPACKSSNIHTRLDESHPYHGTIFCKDCEKQFWVMGRIYSKKGGLGYTWGENEKKEQIEFVCSDPRCEGDKFITYERYGFKTRDGKPYCKLHFLAAWKKELAENQERMRKEKEELQLKRKNFIESIGGVFKIGKTVNGEENS